MKLAPMSRVSSFEPGARMKKSASTDSLTKIASSNSLTKVSSTDSLTKVSSMENLAAFSAKIREISSSELITHGTQIVLQGDPGNIGAAVLAYIAANRRIIQRRPDLLLHPRKLSLPMMSMIVNSSFTEMLMHRIHDHTVQLAAHVTLDALKLAFTVI